MFIMQRRRFSKVNKKDFLRIVLVCIFAFCLSCQQKNKSGHMEFPDHLTASGELAQRIDLAQQRLSCEHPFDIEFVIQDVARTKGLQRRFEEYEGDVSGRILGAWSYSARLLGKRPPKLDSIAQRVLEYQNEDGSFGENQQDKGWDQAARQMFGHGRLLVGLVNYYQLSGDKQFLQAAHQLCDFIISTVPHWEMQPPGPIDSLDRYNYSRWQFIQTHRTSVLEGLMMTYDIVKDRNIIKAAKIIASRLPDFGYYHSHSYMNTMVGMIKLYQVTGQDAIWNRVVDIYWHSIMRYARRPDGAMAEWFPTDVRTEGCSLTDWLRLNLMMWQVSQDRFYIEEAELTWLNGLNFHQTSNGLFGHATLNARGYDENYSEAWWCCHMHGLYAYAEILNQAVVKQGDAVWVNFYTPLEITFQQEKTPGFKMETDYPDSGNTVLTCQQTSLKDIPIYLRIPHWTKNWSVTINDKPAHKTCQNGYVTLTKQWQKGDRIKLSFPIDLRVEDEKGNPVTRRTTSDHTYHAALFYHGPLLLGIYGSENFPSRIFINPDKNYTVKSSDVISQSDFKHNKAHYELKTTRKGVNNLVHLAPISEITAHDVWHDTLQSYVRNGENPIKRDNVRIIHAIELIEE